MTFNKKYTLHFFVLCFLIFENSCTKFITVGPPKTELVSATVFSSDAAANAAVVGIYSQMMASQDFASLNITLYGAISADEFIDYSSDPFRRQFYYNGLTASNTDVTGFWGDAFQYIHAANAVIEGLQENKNVSPQNIKQLTGEALFIRSFCNFYLVNFFGKIPLITGTNYQVNAPASRMDRTIVYNQIIADLQAASDSLPGDYSFSQGEKTRPNKWAAEAFLARVFLYTGDWTNAITLSTAVINNSSAFSMDSDVNQVFLKNNPEAIWQLAPVTARQNTYDGFAFILTGNPTSTFGQVSLTNIVMNAFDSNDYRRINWIGTFADATGTYYFPFKYKQQSSVTATEYLTVFRLAEQYLIRSEALAEQNNINASLADLNVIRNRAGLSNSNANDQQSLFIAITQERQKEFFTEWGHRWLDLKRSGTIDEVLSVEKSGWKSTDTLYPIPQTEIQKDINLTQNPGY
jgi:hypothetical protein